jgi:lipoprotein-anchoring transpeptidase ErfK/SrfK
MKLTNCSSQEFRISGARKRSSLDLLVSCVLCLSICVGALPAESAQKQQRTQKPKPAVDMTAVQTQVMLDRAGFSPGEIDGTIGTSTTRALDAFTKNGGKADALPEDAVIAYRITEQDAAGPFTPNIPEDMVEKSKLQALGYADLVEALGERFHTSPALLKRMNPGARFAAGEEIQVPNAAATVQPVGPARGRQSDPAPSAENPAATIVTVKKSTSDLTVVDGTGKILMYAPVTTGSEHDPLPVGEWKVTGVQRDPKFHYNPDLFWDADAKHSKATIPSGPNSPVGVVWVDISKPHYGLHGTPEPATVGKTASHGCVRLTNWDANKLASLVRPGTKVVFTE